MSLVSIAQQAGTTSSNLEKLIATGQGSPNLANRIGTTSAKITEFVRGYSSPGIARALGTTTKNAQLLRDMIGREGAIGLIIGIACGLSYSKK